jgi:hypothetical protein
MSSFFMQNLFVVVLFAFLLSCNNNNDAAIADVQDAATEGSVHAGAADTIVTSAQPLVLTGCYEMTLKKDSAFLDLQVTDTVVTGTLNFNFFEKDRNSGTLQGVLRNDKILADYTFQSEGVTSVREVVFQIKDSTLLQGHGELKQQGTKLVFADPENLQYQTANPFIKVACPTQ